MGKIEISKEMMDRILTHPERRYSIAAYALTGNWAAGLVIEQLRGNEGKQAEIDEISDACMISYWQCRRALDDLEEAGLIIRYTTGSKSNFRYSKADRKVERIPYTYMLTDLGRRCTPRQAATPPPGAPQGGTILMIDGLPSPTITPTTNNVTAPTPKKTEKELSEFQKRLFGKA